MKDTARVVIIGGGVVGASILYHLAKAGWSDVVLCERTELTAGSTWHAAGLLPLFNMSYSVGQIHKYSVDLYKSLEKETGQNVSFHVTGNLRLANSQERMDEYLNYCATANTIGVPFEIIGVDEIKKLWPLCNTEGLVGALYHPQDGHIAPVDLTNALAKGARNYGAEIYRQTEVKDIKQQKNGEWVIYTDKGNITCEHVVTATGNYARQTARMVGLDIPAIPVEHQYIVTDAVPELIERQQQNLPEMAVLRESDNSYYLREERQGYILGPYEKGAPARFIDKVPETFGQDLFEGDLERLMPHVEAAIHRVPSFAHAGIKDIINGPICYTPDGNPLLGQGYCLKNYWLAEGFSFGVTAAGGAGKYLAQQIMHGEADIDMLAVDPRRFGAYANRNYARLKNEECYEHVFIIHYPMEERLACRPLKQSPCHDRLDKAGAVWGQRYGWERPNWFALQGIERKDNYSFRRSNWFDHVGHEVHTMRDKVGMIDLTSFSKFDVTGDGAGEYLEKLVANTIPKKIGGIKLCHALTPSGAVRSEFTICKLAENHYYLVSSGAAERYDYDYLYKNLPDDYSVRLDNITTSRGVFVLAGPKSRDVMQKLTEADLSNDSFKWLTAQTINLALASDVRALRVNFVGSLGWELHHPIEYQNHLYDAIMDAGAEFDIGLVGMRAMDSMRLEKSYRMWGTDLNQENSILQAGLDRFVQLNKQDFIGKNAVLQESQNGITSQYVTIKLNEDNTSPLGIADPFGNEPIYLPNGQMIGRGTAGGYGHYVGYPILLGYVDSKHAHEGTEVEILILDKKVKGKIMHESPYDPKNEALQS